MNLIHRRVAILFASLLTLIVPVGSSYARALPASVDVQLDKPGIQISPTLYGLMTEEINHSYDGGLYAELIRNRAFQDDPKQPAGWSVVKTVDSSATIDLDRDQPVNSALPVSLKLTASTASAQAPAAVANDGFWGMGILPQTRYSIAFFGRADSRFHGPVNVSLASRDGKQVYCSGKIEMLTTGWQKYTLQLNSTADFKATSDARLVMSVEQPGTIWLSLVSCFPPTFNDRSNGSRRDLMQLMKEMKPSFLRFPGGNYVECQTFATRFNWKEMIGPIDKRPGHMGCWGYRSSDGFGLPEFLNWCEDLNMEPVLADVRRLRAQRRSC